MSNLKNKFRTFDNYSIKTKLVFGILIILIPSIVFTSFLITNSFYEEMKSIILEKSSLELEQHATITQNSFLQIKESVIEYGTDSEIQKFAFLHNSNQINSEEYEWTKKSITEKFLDFSNSNDFIFQVRYLDINGNEVIRVNKDKNKSIIFEDSELSYKGDQYYFLEGIKHNAGSIYISKVDLNRENGEIQIPYIPTIRIGIPIFDNNFEKTGLFLINVNIQKHLLSTPNLSFGDIILSDSDGYFLIHPNQEKLYGNILNNEHNYYFEQPELKVNVNEMNSKIHHDVDESEFRNWVKIFYNEPHSKDYWLLVNVVHESILFEPLYETNFIIISSVGVSLAISIIATLIISQSFTNPIKKIIEQLHKVTNGDLESSLNMSRKDEFGKMSNSFDQMIEKLQKTKNLEKKYEEKIKQNLNELENYKQALDSSSMVTIADSKGIILEVNDEFCKVSKYDRSELIGKNYNILKSGLHPSIFYQKLWNNIQRGKVWKGDIKNKTKDGKFYWEKKTIIPKFGKDGTPDKYISISTEITKQKEYELQLEGMLEKLSKNERLKDEFASMVTHELKTPLTPIKGYCEMLKEEMCGKLNEEQLEFVDVIESNATQLEDLIGDILDAQKLEMGHMKFHKNNIETNKILEDIEKTFKPMFAKKHALLKRAFSKNYIINTDEVRIKQVFYNLIRNSIDFIPTENGIIEIGFISNDKNITFFVKDNGNGIPVDKQSRIFKKFYQADTSQTRKHGGTGLGLAVCKGIVESLGGNIWFESESGKGTTFYFNVVKTISPEIKNS